MATSGPCGGILVVDDDPDIRDSLREVLEDEGYEVACVGNGREALDHLKTANPRPCVILLDLMMPVMDGWQFRKEQKQDADDRRHPAGRHHRDRQAAGADRRRRAGDEAARPDASCSQAIERYCCTARARSAVRLARARGGHIPRTNFH